MQIDGLALRGQFAGFARWWRRELSHLVPSGVRGLLGRWRRTLQIRTDGREFEFRLHHAGGEISLFRTVADRGAREATGRAIKKTLANYAGRYDKIVLRLSDELVLKRELRLPYAARASLSEAAGYDLDRQTPFSIDKVWYGVSERDADRREKLLTARLHLVRRADLDPLLDCLGHAGLHPDHVDAEEAGPDMLPPHLRKRADFPGGRGLLLLAVLVLAFSYLSASLPMRRIEDARESLAPAMREARARALAVENLRQEIDLIRAREQELFTRKRHNPLVIGLMAEITNALPASAFLIEFSVDRGEVSLSGYAKKASDILSEIEAQPDLEAARFLSPVTQEPRVGRERFSLSARISSAGARTADRDSAP